LSRFITSNRLAIRKLLKKYKKWTGLTTLTPTVEYKILSQSGSFTKVQLDYALDLYTAYLEAVRSPFKKTVPRQLSATDLAQRRSIAARDGRVSNNDLFDGSDLEFDLALATQVQGTKSERATFWVHKDNAVELRILLLQYMRGFRHRTDSAGSKSAMRRGSSDETPSTVGTLVLDNAARVAASGKAYDTPTYVEGSHAAATARWNAEGQAVFSITNASEESNTLPKHPAAVQLPRQKLAAFLNVDGKSITTDTGDENLSSNGTETLKTEAARSWLRQHPEIGPLVYTRFHRSRFVGLENQPEQAAWAAFDEDVDFSEVNLRNLREPSFFTRAPGQGGRFPHAILTVRTEGDCSNLFNALNGSHLVSSEAAYQRKQLLTNADRTCKRLLYRTSCSFNNLP